MIDVEPLIVSGLDRLVPLPGGERADWDGVLRRAGIAPARRRPRARWFGLGLAVSAVAAAVLIGTPVGAAIVHGLGDFSDWLSGTPGKPAAESEAQRFEAANGHSWAAFPKDTRLRELVRADVDGKRYVLYGFRSGTALCLRLKGVSLGHTTAPACAPVSMLAHVSAPIVVVTGNGSFQDAHGHSSAAFSFGIAADGVSRVDVGTIDGMRPALVGGNAYLWVENEPSTGERALTISAVTRAGRRTTVAVHFGGMPDLTFGPRPRAQGPSRVEAPLRRPTIGWYDRREPRGLGLKEARLTPEQRLIVHASGFTRFVKPDPLSDVVVGLTGNGGCLVVIDGGTGCGPPASFFARGPLNVTLFGGGSLNGSDQFLGLAGAAADGVARIRIFLADGQRQTAALRDNLFTALVPYEAPIRLVAYAPDGKVVGIETLPGIQFGPRVPPSATHDLQVIRRLHGPNGAVATVRLGRTVAHIRCWRVDFSTGQTRAACRPLLATGPWVEVEVAQPAGRDVFIIGNSRPPVVQVRLLFDNGETITTRAVAGLFVIAIPRSQLRPQRQLAFAIGYDQSGNRIQRQGVLYRATR